MPAELCVLISRFYHVLLVKQVNRIPKGGPSRFGTPLAHP